MLRRFLPQRVTLTYKLVAVLIVVVAGGCATSDAVRVRDGVTYGVTEGPFRGRWWNYYERGRSYLDGGFYDEARADFAKALAERNVDQHWARTYGLHFAPQYFPNREAGISEFYQGNLEQALSLLRRSYDQEPSARASYYLRRVLEKTLVPGADTTGPRVTVTKSGDGPVVSTHSITLTVSAWDDGYLDRIFVDSARLSAFAPASTIEERTSMNLAPGVNTVVVAATDMSGNRTETTFEIAGDFDGPSVSFDAPSLSENTVTGVLFDDSGVASFELGMAEARLSPRADGIVRFEVSGMPPGLAAARTFRAVDTLGNETTGDYATSGNEAARAHGGVVFARAEAPVRNRGHRMQFAIDGPDGPRVRMANLVDGQRYMGDELVVDIEVEAPAGAVELTVNGIGVSLLGNRRVQRLSRRVALPVEGANEIVTTLRDAAGNETTTRATVERVFSAVEDIGQRLSLAIVGNVWEGPNRDAAVEERFVADELTRALYDEKRFDLVTRELLPQALTEQELRAALADRSGPSPLQHVVPAELMAVGMVRKDVESVEIILQAISLETSQLMGYADVAGAVSSKDDLHRLVQDLALRFLQEFPRVQGRVVDMRRDSDLVATISSADRIRRNAKCLVFRKGEELRDPATGVSLGFPTEILSEGHVDSVHDDFSIVSLDAQGDMNVEVEDFVITK